MKYKRKKRSGIVRAFFSYVFREAFLCYDQKGIKYKGAIE